MARPRRKQSATPTPLEVELEEFLNALSVRGYSKYTVENRRAHIRLFLDWAHAHGLREPAEITRPVLERYQRHLYYYRKKNGEPLSFRSQLGRLVPLRVWFKWMTRQNHILHNPASEIELPRLGRTLPKEILSIEEVERVMMHPDIAEPVGLRDRAILEVLYSCGLRRLEIIRLKLPDLYLDRGLILVRQGKGKKDRYVPIGERGAAWLNKYIAEARPTLVSEPDDLSVFLSADGEPFDNRAYLSLTVRRHVTEALSENGKRGKTGSCHLFRHTMATHMHENGADIRFIQQMLGHEDIKSTQVYTRVALRMLQQVYASTHPGAFLDPAGRDREDI
ncbi:MAG TPA: site-specific tyrosine recombinase XerC [Acidobacteriaceae bacterium]|nr:site-specific tyrosine recombinase XerC [Acidobacteriaceae bacterium]